MRGGIQFLIRWQARALLVRQVTLAPHVNEVVNERALLRRLQLEIAQLRRQLVGHLFS